MKLSKLTAVVLTGTSCSVLLSSAMMYTTSAEMMTSPQSIVDEGATSVQMRISDVEGTKDTNAGVDVINGPSVTNQSYFRAGSVTKTFIATTILQLVDEGKINLDKPIDTYIPSKINGGNVITVRQLLSHTSGLQDYTPSLPLYNVASYPTTEAKLKEMLDAGYNTDQLLAYINSRPLASTPGATFSYANSNFVVAGAIITEVTHKPYAKNVEERILSPLGMTHTFFLGTDQNLPEPAAHGYRQAEGGISDSTTGYYDMTRYNGSQVNAAGEMVSTTGDLNIFMKALSQGKLMSAGSFAQMKASSPENPNYGLGLMVYDTQCGQIIGHAGNIYGYATQMYSTSDGKRQVAVSGTEGKMDYVTVTVRTDALAGQALCQ